MSEIVKRKKTLMKQESEKNPDEMECKFKKSVQQNNFSILALNSDSDIHVDKILQLTTTLLEDFNIKTLEELEETLRNYDFEKPINGQIIYKILKNIDQLQKFNLRHLNTRLICIFLIKLMYKKTKVEIGIKAYAYEILIRIDKNYFEEIFIYDLPYITNFKEVKVKFIIDFFRSSKKEDLFPLLFKDNRIDKFEKCINKMLAIDNLDFVYAFISYYLKNSDLEEVEKGIVLIFNALNFLLNKLADKNIEIDKKYVKQIFNYLLTKMLNRKNTKRYQIAGFLLKTNLENIIFNKKKVFKICKKLLDDKSLKIYEVSILLLSIFKNEYLVTILDNCEQNDKIIIILRYLNNLDNAVVYKKILEVKNSKHLHDLDIRINDLPLFAKVFYSFNNKSVIKFVKIDKIVISDIYTLDLALHYSKYYPNKIDEEFIASLILEDSENILRNIKLIEILNNIYQNLKLQIKQKLIDKFKGLILQSPYTKSIGLFFYKINYLIHKENFKSDYYLVIYASMNHPDFIKYFNEFVWSTNKFRSLIYILQYNLELGIVYAHKLKELLNSDIYENPNIKYNLLEFLNFLTNLLDKNLDDRLMSFYYKLILDNKNVLYKFLQQKDQSIKIQTSKLLVKSTFEKILLKEETIPRLVVFHRYDDNLQIYSDLIRNNILNIFNLRIKEYKAYRNIYDEYFLKNIFKKEKITIENFFVDENDLCLKYFVLYLNFNIVEFTSGSLFLGDHEILVRFINKIKDCTLQEKNEIFDIIDNL